MRPKRRVGIYGGTFNPPHIGHLNAAVCFAESLALDEVLIIPAGTPPHKNVSDNVSTDIRFEMTRAAFEPLGEKYKVSDYEIAGNGPDYTVNTLRHFSSSGKKLFLLCGTDMFISFESWREFRKIFALAALVCMPREEDSQTVLRKKMSEYKSKYKARCMILEGKTVELSSTELREMIRNKEDVSGLIPEAVCEIIRREGLYV